MGGRFGSCLLKKMLAVNESPIYALKLRHTRKRDYCGI
jgi:hypothetical protein